MANTSLKLKATIYWASLDKVNDLSGKYQVDLCNLTEGAVTALKELGVVARVKASQPECGFMITCKSKYPIVAQDTDGDEIEKNIGNGTKANCIISSYAWEFKGKKGMSPQLDKLTITELVEYVKEGAVEDSEFESADFL